jgi:hypothetical protein
MTRWSAMMTCVGLMAMLQLVHIGAQQATLYKYDNVQVEQTAPFEYWMTPDGQPRFHTTVCRDYMEPGFTTGMTLDKVIFVDRGSCWSLDPNLHAGYFIRRRQDGQPQLLSRR